MRSNRIVRERAAYQIWWLIKETGGDCTVYQMAEITGLSPNSCAKIVRARGWSTMTRTTRIDSIDVVSDPSIDEFIESTGIGQTRSGHRDPLP